MLLSFLGLPSPAHMGMLALLVLGFGFVIFWHELGHFLAAKWVGIRVEQFAVGFGHALISWRKGIGFRVGNTQKDYRERAEQHLLARDKSEVQLKETIGYSDLQIATAAEELGLGETEYRLNWIPLGGYVKMLGQDDLKPDAQAEDPRAYNRKSIPARMLVISAGVIMNIILAAIGFMVLFLIGFNVPPAWVGNVQPNSPAQKAGLHVGDHILWFDGKWEADFTKIMLDTALVKADTPVKMIVSRPDRPGDPDTTYHNVELTVTPERPVGDNKFLAIGFSPPPALRGVKKDDQDPLDESKFLQSNPKDYLIIQPGDVVTAINGEPVKADDYVKFDQALQGSHGQPVTLTIQGAGGAAPVKRAFQPHFEDPFSGDFNLAGFLPRVAIGNLPEKSPMIGKLKPFDVIAYIHDASPWYAPSRELFMKRMLENGQSGHAIDIDVIREGETKVVKLTDLHATASIGDGKKGLGVGPMLDEWHTVVADVVPDSPAAKAGIKNSDTLTAINGTPVSNWYQVQHLLADLTPDAKTGVATAKVTFTRVEADQTVEHHQDLSIPADQIQNIKGVRYSAFLFMDQFTKPRKTSSPMQAAGWGITETRDFTLQFYLTLRRMAVDRSISPSNMMGPLGIFTGGKAFAYRGIDWLLWFLSMISANLAVVNFLPIPVVDGGQFMFLIVEKIKGKPLSPRAMAIAQYAGLAFLAAVVLFVTYHDIWRMVG